MQNQIANPLRLLHKLYKKGSRQYMEWSIKISHEKVEHRYKPTLYVYQAEGGNRFQCVSDLLDDLDCPSELIHRQRVSSSQAMYQGLRIPSSGSVDNCMFVHENGKQSIDSYRWTSSSHFDTLRYVYESGLEVNDVKPVIHRHFISMVECLAEQRAFKEQRGIWFQEYNGKIQEVYLAFPQRPPLHWLTQALKGYFSASVFNQLKKWDDLKFRNIGFESCEKENPEATIYFTFPIVDKFPRDYDDTVRMTYDFFNVRPSGL
jgi:hypothetical protein